MEKWSLEGSRKIFAEIFGLRALQEAFSCEQFASLRRILETARLEEARCTKNGLTERVLLEMLTDALALLGSAELVHEAQAIVDRCRR